MNTELKPPIQHLLRGWIYLPPAGLMLYRMVQMVLVNERIRVGPIPFIQSTAVLAIWTYVCWFAFPPKPETARVFVRIGIIALGSLSLILLVLMLLGPGKGGIAISWQEKGIMALHAISLAPAIDYVFKLVKPNKTEPPPNP
jgi:hypothetical protein